MSATNVFAFIPAYREQISVTTFESTHTMASTLLSKGIGIAFGTYSWYDIAELRNIVLSYWYDLMPDSTHLLFIDDDMGFSPQAVLDMISIGEPVIGAMYRKKTENYDWAASGLPLGTADFKGRSFLEVEGIGAGLMLIRRDAIDKMVEHFPELIRDHMMIGDFQACKRTLGLFDQMPSGKGKVSEDISFCRRWRETGGKVWASVGHEITHVGWHAFKGCYARWRMETDAKRVEDQKLDGSGAAASAAAG